MPRLIYTEAAIADLVRIHEFWVERGGAIAVRAIGTIRIALDGIMARPASFRPVLDRIGQREAIIQFGGGSFVARFQHDSGTGDVTIIRVRHDREVLF